LFFFFFPVFFIVSSFAGVARPVSGGPGFDAVVLALRGDPFLRSLVEDADALQQLCLAVKDQRSRVQEETASALVVAFRLFGGDSLTKLFDFMCERVVGECSSSEQVLAVDSLYKKTMANCLRELMGKQYFMEALGATLSEICTYDVVLNASKADAVQELAIVDHLFSTAQAVFDNLKRARPRLPRDVVEALLMLRNRLQRKFEHLGHLLCERYLFGLLTNVIVQPHPLIVSRAPGSGAQRSLVALAKVVQTTYSGMTSNPSINDSDNYSSMLARFVSENYGVVESYVGLPEACPISTAQTASLTAGEVTAAKASLMSAKNGESASHASPRMSPSPVAASSVSTPAAASSSSDAEVKKGRSFTSRSPRKEAEKEKESKEKSPSLLRSRTATLFGGGSKEKEKEKSSPMLSPRKEEAAPVPEASPRTRGKTLGSAFKKLVSKDKPEGEMSKSKGSIPEVQPRSGWSKGVAPSPEIAAALQAAKAEQEKLRQEQELQKQQKAVPPPDRESNAMTFFDDDTTGNIGEVELHNPLDQLSVMNGNIAALHASEVSDETANAADAEFEAARAKQRRKEEKALRLLKEAEEAKKLYHLRVSGMDSEVRSSGSSVVSVNPDDDVATVEMSSQEFVTFTQEHASDRGQPGPDASELSEIGNMLSELGSISFDSLEETKKMPPPALPPKKQIPVPPSPQSVEEPDEIVIPSSPTMAPPPDIEVLELDELDEIVSPRSPSVRPTVSASPSAVTAVPTLLNRPKKPSGAKGRRAPNFRGEEGPEVKTVDDLIVEEEVAKPVSVKKPSMAGAFMLPGLSPRVQSEDGAEETSLKSPLGGQKVLTVGSASSFGSGVMPKFDPTKVTLRKGNSSQMQGAAREAQLLMEEKRKEEEARAAREQADALLKEMEDEEWARAEKEANEQAEQKAREDAEKAAKAKQRLEEEQGAALFFVCFCPFVLKKIF
jgi:hypothetical protein